MGLDTLAEELAKHLQEVRAEREELVIAERLPSGPDRGGGHRDRRPDSRPEELEVPRPRTSRR